MKNSISFLILSILTISVSLCQNTLLIKKRVFDKQSKSPLPYVTIMIKNSNIGTYSNEDGIFEIPCLISDTILLSSIGYENIIFCVSKNNDSIFLEKSNITLNTVTVTPVNYNNQVTSRWIGYYKNKSYGNFMGIKAAATWIDNPYSRNLKIQKVHCVIDKHRVYNLYDSKGSFKSKKIKNMKMLIRLRLFAANHNRELVEEDLLPENILLETEKKQENLDFDLNSYDIYIPPSGVYVCIELLGIIKDGIFHSYEGLLKEDVNQFNVKFIDTENHNNYVKNWRSNTWVSISNKTFRFSVQLAIPKE